MSNLAQTLVACAGTVAAVIFLWRAGLRITQLVARVVHFLDDWSGADARPGVPRRLGVIERLDQQDARITAVEHQTRQLTPNGGSHLADKVSRIEGRLDTQDHAVQALARIEKHLGIDAHVIAAADSYLSEGPP